MAITVTKGKIGTADIRFYTSASPTFSRTTSTGGSTTRTAIAATHIPLSNASPYWTQRTVERVANEVISRYFGISHSIATYAAGAKVGQHSKVFGFKNALLATSIQAAASNAYLIDGIARIVIPDGTFTAATPIRLPRVCFVFGNGRGTIIRQNSTIQTSRLFTISGQVGATNSALRSNATIGTSIVSVITGNKFTRGDWMIVRDSHNMELQKVLSVSGNDITVEGKLRHTYRSGATVASASLVYPAFLLMDDLDLRLTSATQGIGVAGTYLVESVIGEGMRISGFAKAAVYLQRSEVNEIKPLREAPSSVSSGKGYGVWLTDNSAENRIGGKAQGITKDVADGRSINNFTWGVEYRGGYPASGISDPLAQWYRTRKPDLSYVTYAATTAVSCPADSTRPSEVYINGHIFRNYGTVICDVSRTKTPVTATIGGMDRGPAIATYPVYLYAVPSVHPSATRQWDLIGSITSPATGPRASATFPQWSWLGAVSILNPIGLDKFNQVGDQILLRDNIKFFEDLVYPVPYQATVKVFTVPGMPLQANMGIFKMLGKDSSASTSRGNTEEFFLLDPTSSSTATSNFNGLSMAMNRFSTGAPTKRTVHVQGKVQTSSRQVGYHNTIAASTNFTMWMIGYDLARANFK